MYTEVIPSLRLPKKFKSFDYELPDELKDKVRAGLPSEASAKGGSIVFVPFGKKTVPGVILKIKEKTKIKNIKPIKSIVNNLILPQDLLKIIFWMGKNLDVSLPLALKTILPDMPKSCGNLKVSATPVLENKDSVAEDFSPPQYIKWNNLEKKDEQIINLVKDTLEKNKSVILLEPRLPNVYYMHEILRRNFNEQISIYHSKLKKTETRKIWINALEGKIKIIIATRHGVFLPLKNLELIIFDDEEDDDFKSVNQKPYYDARTIAKLRNVKVASFSQSPSVGTVFQELDRSDTEPKITIIDLKTGNYSPISYSLKKAIQNTLQKEKKVILFINRKGETGTQKVEKELKNIFPERKIVRIDKDSDNNLEDIEKSYIIIGTEYLYKNYLYPRNQIKNIDLIALPIADTLFNYPDFRTDEKAFAWIVKFKNLARQESTELIVQTYSPENQVLRLACINSLDFYKREYEIRKKFGYS